MQHHLRLPMTNDVLLVDTDHSRGLAFVAVLEFIKVEVTLITPQQLLTTSADELNHYLAIFTLESEEVTQFFLHRNKQEKCQYPVVLMANRVDLTELDIVVHLPYLAGLCYHTDYYSMSRVFDKVRLHNRRERRMDNRECQQLIGESASIERINQMIDQVADTNASVLILGESGTGKEVIARNIHAQSSRSHKPFVPINCGAIPADLLESELFGHEKGAFTGAISARQGRFELAEGGVIFLDEIGDMPLPMQVKLLRVLQERCYEKVGSSKSIKTDVRVIAATHRRLEGLIEEGHFREDLFYRLNVFPIDVSPLRERVEDIPLLVREMVVRMERDHRGSVRLSKKAVVMLQHYGWPGNVRELANLLERLAILYPNAVIEVKNLPEKFQSGDLIDLNPNGEEETLVATVQPNISQLPSNGIDMKQYLTDIEISLIEQALVDTNHVVARAATMLNVRRTTLVEKMRKYEIV
jgi:sigma-54 specific flagellar transcriptional regulator A|tara:strand:- start:408 stop:1814 length:1407 start_codon:yes stop_codon:yes gene_type:complete